MRGRNLAGAAIASLATALAVGGSARAGDEPTMSAVVAEQMRGASQEADVVDGVARAGDVAQWTRARDQYLARLESARAQIEESVAAWIRSDKPDPYGQAFLPTIEAAGKLAEARIAYRVLTERAAKGEGSVREKEFRALSAGLAAKTLEAGIHGALRPDAKRGEMTKSADNLRSLMLQYIASGAGMERPWPKFSGKSLVLWLVATKKIDRSEPRALEVLFSPGDATRSVEKAGGAAAFEQITVLALKTDALDLSPFTSYVGRANADGFSLTAEDLQQGAPLLADLSFPDAAIIAFTSGTVKVMTKKELGLDPSDPIVVGPASKSPLLRPLSDK